MIHKIGVTVKLIFLDIDGVLNDHRHGPAGYCGIGERQAQCLNWILTRVPDAMLVITSAWRYLVLTRSMTQAGFERMLLTHGLCVENRIHGFTAVDPDPPAHLKKQLQAPGGGDFDKKAWEELGLKWRSRQILEYLDAFPDVLGPATLGGGITAMVRRARWVVVDDLALEGLEHFVRTDGAVGLTESIAAEVVAKLEAQRGRIANGQP